MLITDFDKNILY